MNTKDEIIEFIKNSNASGALLVTGDWGSGKSYLIKKIAQELNCEKSEFHISIISLFGMDTIASLNHAIKTEYLYASSKFFNKTVDKITKGVGKLVQGGAEVAAAADPTCGVSAGIAKGVRSVMTLNALDYISVKNEFTKGKNKKKFVLVFDDLERSKIDIVELLGAINDYLENKKIIVILIADDKKITDDPDKNKYSDFKEKLIFQTIKIQSNYDEIIDNILETYETQTEGYIDFLKSNVHILKGAFIDSNYNNVRTVKAILASFERVYKEWIKISPELVRLDKVFASFCAIYFEFKANKYTKGPYGYDDRQIKEKYTQYHSFYMFTSIRDWIVEGYFDLELFNKEYANKFTVKDVSDAYIFLQHDFWSLNDSIIRNALPDVLQKAYGGELCFDNIINLLQRTHLLISYGVIALENIDYLKIENGLYNRIEKIKTGKIEEPRKRTFILPETLQDFDPIAKRIYKNIELEDDRKSSWLLRLNVINDIKNFTGMYTYTFKNQSIVSFDDELLNTFFTAYAKADNADKRELYFLIKDLDFANVNISKDQDIELTIKNMNCLIEKLQELSNETSDIMTKIIINSTINGISENIGKVEEKVKLFTSKTRG